MTEEMKFRSWFMVVLEGNITVGTAKRKRQQPTIAREMYYVDSNEELFFIPAQLLTHAENQMSLKHGGNKFVVSNAFRVLVSEKDISDVEGEEE